MLTFQNISPEEAGVPSGAITRCIRRLQQKNVPMHALLIARGDRLIAERYYAPYDSHTLHRMFSISKSLTGLAIGMLEGEGRLSLNDPICDYFPEYVPADVHPWIREMTIRDMLMMRTCHASTTYKLDLKSNWVESFFTTAPTHPAGRFFHYDTSSAHTLAALVVKLTGQNPLNFVKAKIPELGLSERSYMLSDPFGSPIGGSGLVAEPMDILKLGYLLLRGGQLDGRQCLPATFLKEAVSPLSSTIPTAPLPSEACGYGYQIWTGEKGGPVLYGMGGQLVIVLPATDLVIATCADTQGMAGGNQLIYDAIYEEILTSLSDSPLPEDPAHLSELRNLPLQLPVFPGEKHSETAARISGKVYRFAPNRQGFETLKLSFSAGEASLDYRLSGQDCRLIFSLSEERLCTGSFPGYEMRYAASASWITPDTLYIYCHIIDEYVGSVRIELQFGENDVTVFLKKVEESLFSEYNGHLYGISMDE